LAPFCSLAVTAAAAATGMCSTECCSGHWTTPSDGNATNNLINRHLRLVEARGVVDCSMQARRRGGESEMGFDSIIRGFGQLILAREPAVPRIAFGSSSPV
jgi:hypothetical protein